MQAQIFKSQCILVAACVKKLCELESGHDFQEQEHFKRASNHFAAFAEATALMPLGSVNSKMVDAAQNDAAAKLKDKDVCVSIAFVVPLAPTSKALVA